MEYAGEFVAAVADTVPARARFIGRYIADTTYTSLSVGLVAGQIGVMLPCGPLVPFMVGSWVGYTAGIVKFWHAEKSKVMDCVENYPRLVRYVIATEMPWAKVDVAEGSTLMEWVNSGDTLTRMGRQAWVTLATQTCLPLVDELQSQIKGKIVEEYLESSPGGDDSGGAAVA